MIKTIDEQWQEDETATEYNEVLNERIHSHKPTRLENIGAAVIVLVLLYCLYWAVYGALVGETLGR